MHEPAMQSWLAKQAVPVCVHTRSLRAFYCSSGGHTQWAGEVEEKVRIFGFFGSGSSSSTAPEESTPGQG